MASNNWICTNNHLNNWRHPEKPSKCAIPGCDGELNPWYGMESQSDTVTLKGPDGFKSTAKVSIHKGKK